MPNHPLQEQIKELPLTPGVYLFKDKNNRVLYVGKSVRLRDRVKSYFTLRSHLGPRTRSMLAEATHIDTISTETELEALLLELELIKKYTPLYNSQWKDDKAYKYIEIKNAGKRRRVGIQRMVVADVWPWVTTTRQKKDPDSLYFGPFPEGTTVNRVITSVRRVFPWCKYRSTDEARREGKACFYSHIELCPGICEGRVTLDEYWKINDQLVTFLKGKKKVVQRYFTQQMSHASEREDFERAAMYRDLLNKLDYITQSFHTSREYLENVNLREDLRAEEVLDLTRLIGQAPPKDPLTFYIEGYDISNLGTQYTVGSRVASVGGEADKSKYRRYRIRREQLPNDFAAMKEMLTRRLKGKDPLPDLLLVDGGKGQLHTVMKVMEELDIPTPIIGLAKRFETIIVPREEGDYEIALPLDSPARRLVTRLRDESHRFAQNYHKLLRSKGMIGTAPKRRSS